MKNELGPVLQEAGLPTDPFHVIGQLYQFECEHGSHHNVLVGTVLAIQISDEGGLALIVSNPTFGSSQLVGIMYNNGKWMACVKCSDIIMNKEFFEGNFRLLLHSCSLDY